MPVNFLSEVERQRLSHFPEVIPESDQIQYFTLTEEDQEPKNQERQGLHPLRPM
jgi:hypothetical protein